MLYCYSHHVRHRWTKKVRFINMKTYISLYCYLVVLPSVVYLIILTDNII